MKIPKEFECLLEFSDNNEIAELLYKKLYKEDISINIKQNIINWIIANKDINDYYIWPAFSYAMVQDLELNFGEEFLIKYITKFNCHDDFVIYLRKFGKELTDNAISLLKSTDPHNYYKYVEVEFNEFKKATAHFPKYKIFSCTNNDSINWFNCKNKRTIDRIVKEQINTLKSGNRIVYPLPETQAYIKLNSL